MPPKVWFHGGQSTSTGGSSRMKARPALIMDWLAHSMSWVLMTPLGWPVEPEVNRNFAIVSGPTFAWASSTAAVGDVAASEANGLVSRSNGGSEVTTTSTSVATGGAIVRAKAFPLAA